MTLVYSVAGKTIKLCQTDNLFFNVYHHNIIHKNGMVNLTNFRGLVQSPCGQISAMTLGGGEGVLVHDVSRV